MGLWRRLGLSVDWRQEYSTINDHCRRLAQVSFVDLYEKGHIYNVEAPTMWDVDFQTAVAQAEVEDRKLPGAMHHVRFGVEGSDRQFTIATTRPELLPACVGVAAHPEDARYKDLFGRRAVTPLFRASVPIFPTELADPEKGTGILMVCTFGDATDIIWWREHKLALRQILGQDGRLLPVTFGQEPFASLAPDAANAFYEQLVGKTAKAAQKQVVELLRDPSSAAVGDEPPLAQEPQPIEHPVKFFEKGDRPLEYITTKQWFVRLMDKKEQLLEAGDRISWHPDFMRLRYRNWTENLQLDWCISRQRFFGVPFPIWYALDAQGVPDTSRPIIAERARLPVDPSIAAPAGYDEAQRGRPGGFIAESDVFDTWFTSSLTPQITSGWEADPERHRRLFPTDLRPQSHEIIRTWAFYTIVKSLLHEESVPWARCAISGWILDPERKKMSKSRGNVVTPMHLLDEYGADGVRYWAACARLGVDTAFDEKVLKVGKRLLTKIFNASKFVLSQAGEGSHVTEELDVDFLLRLRELTQHATSLYERLDYAGALRETEAFFWNNFTDTFIELAKARARGEGADEAARGSAVTTLRRGLNVLLRLFAPALPYISEEVWSWAFAEEGKARSIHRAPWPGEADFADLAGVSAPDVFSVAVGCLTAINKSKAAAGVSTGRSAERLTVAANGATADRLRRVIRDVMAAARARDYAIEVNDELADGELSVIEAEFTHDARD
jgi:valyl-tRNA synthetase